MRYLVQMAKHAIKVTLVNGDGTAQCAANADHVVGFSYNQEDGLTMTTTGDGENVDLGRPPHDKATAIMDWLATRHPYVVTWKEED